VNVEDIRPFIPSKNYASSQDFYQALGLSMSIVTDEMSLFENGECTFFLHDCYNQDLANNLMFQLCVTDINDAFKTISAIKMPEIKYEPIKQESWGKVIYLWGPSGELWHVTELN